MQFIKLKTELLGLTFYKESSMKDFGIDIETLGTKPGCPIIEMACVYFDEKGIQDSYDTVIDLQSNFEAGLVPEADTLEFWFKQPEEIRDHLFGTRTRKVSLRAAFSNLEYFLMTHSNKKLERRIWVRGLTFDIPIMHHAAIKSGYNNWDNMFDFRNFQDVRMMDLFGLTKTPNPHEHSALHDAIAQSKDVMNIYKMINSKTISVRGEQKPISEYLST